jgi:hypothetical protein
MRRTILTEKVKLSVLGDHPSDVGKGQSDVFIWPVAMLLFWAPKCPQSLMASKLLQLHEHDLDTDLDTAFSMGRRRTGAALQGSSQGELGPARPFAVLAGATSPRGLSNPHGPRGGLDFLKR